MIIMNLKLNNFLAFNDFEINMSYPKKIVNSSIEEEHLAKRKNFRYKKLIILMGANATGKTALGRVMMAIFNFINKKEYSVITDLIEDKTKPASFVIDMAYSECLLCRVTAKFEPVNENSYEIKDIAVDVATEYIKSSDSYEQCLARLIAQETAVYDNYIESLEHVPQLSWMFKYPIVSSGYFKPSKPDDPEQYCRYLSETLKTLDPRIVNVTRIPDSEDAYIVKYPFRTVIIKDGNVTPPNVLSSGTAEGIGVAEIISSMKLHSCEFYYCDEKFSHIHSDAEKAFLSLFVELLGEDRQLFFTSHNSDILDMDLPKHSFTFLRRDESNCISCAYASDYLKKNNESLKNAVENDLFSAAPNVGNIYALKEF